MKPSNSERVPRIGIAIGDVTGIGPEVTLKALAALLPQGDTRYVLFGSATVLERLNKQLRLNLSLELRNEGKPSGRISVHDPLARQPLCSDLAPGARAAADAAVVYLTEGTQTCLRSAVDALVTAPVSKEAIIRAGHSTFVGQTEFLSQLAGTERTVMMLLGEDDRSRWLRVALATTHVPIRKVADTLTQAKIELAIELAARACRDLGLPRAKVAVCGLNPHAGEGGKMGTEEIDLIIPAVKKAQQRGVDVTGPFSADTLFYYVYRGDYDAVVAMYHDQGLVPLKMIGFERGVNWTLGLPFVRTSPDHGTAYDIAGTGRADPASMMAAIRLAEQLITRKRCS